MGFLIKIGMCVAEKSASISVMACFNVQRSYNYEISSHSLKRKYKSKESESGQKSEVTSRDKFKDSEKDGQKVEVTFEDEFKGSKKDDQATFEDGSEGLEKNDHNNQSLFISIDWHDFRLKKSELNFNISVRLQMDSKKLRNYDKVYRKSTYGLEVILSFKRVLKEIGLLIVNKVFPLFTYMQATFVNKVKFHWVEHDIEPSYE
ncbi:unnamed protein product [Rhizophagus irregularis]|nr:unnamed protein product [Rhizophagus irregularis]